MKKPILLICVGLLLFACVPLHVVADVPVYLQGYIIVNGHTVGQ